MTLLIGIVLLLVGALVTVGNCWTVMASIRMRKHVSMIPLLGGPVAFVGCGLIPAIGWKLGSIALGVDPACGYTLLALLTMPLWSRWKRDRSRSEGPQ
ncbi:MAG TPA: hypothetical protein VFU90_00585 [Candidatus Tumulicola sp.]|nr:hypothetical protein [Candidatus Tumulicola sp.]